MDITTLNIVAGRLESLVRRTHNYGKDLEDVLDELSDLAVHYRKLIDIQLREMAEADGQEA
jgi:hypothetical protein